MEDDLALTFSSAVAAFYFGTKGTTNQEAFTLDLTPNPAGGVWSTFIPYPGSTFPSNSGLGTPVFSAAGPNGGNPVTTITLATNPVTKVDYRLLQQGSNSTPEEILWGSHSLGGPLPPNPVPEPATIINVSMSLAAMVFLRRRR